MQRLINEEISELKEKMSEYQETISQVIYEQFKTATVLANTVSLRGKTGDSFKSYVNTVHLNLTQKIINIAEEIQQSISQMETTFLDYESHKSGKVESDTLQQVAEKVQDSNTDFDTFDAKSSNLLSRASEFIATTSLPSSIVSSAYRDSINQIKDYKDDLNKTDVKATNELKNVKGRVDSLEQQIKDLFTVYHDNDSVRYDEIGNITSEPWYSNENNATFAVMLEDDPFVSEMSKHTFYEDQWVAGLNGDVFASYDHAFLNAEGSKIVNNGVTTYGGSAKLFEANGYAQLTDYAKTNGTLSVGEVGGDVTYGNGFAFNAYGHAAKLEGTAIIGTDDFNGHINFNAEVLSANANFAFQPKDESGDYKYKIGGNATAWKVEANTGVTLFSIDDFSASAEDYSNEAKAEKSLLGVDLAGSVGKQVRGEIEVSGITAFELDFIDVKANTLKVDLAFGLGLKVDLNYPTINFKWPW